MQILGTSPCLTCISKPPKMLAMSRQGDWNPLKCAELSGSNSDVWSYLGWCQLFIVRPDFSEFLWDFEWEEEWYKDLFWDSDVIHNNGHCGRCRLLWQLLRQSLCPLSLWDKALEEKLKCSQGCKGIFLPVLRRQELQQFSVWARS